MVDISDGAIVGSAIIKIIDEYGEAAPKYVGEYVKAMKDCTVEALYFMYVKEISKET